MNTASKKKIETKEFKGNILVTITDKEVRLWVCNEKGQNIYRFKAMGTVYNYNEFITIGPNFETQKEKINDERGD